jgi:hypothetical protein
MPIDFNRALVDRKRKRLPKQISQHLFPKKEDYNTRILLETTFLLLLKDPRFISYSQTLIRSSCNRRYSS